jgi:hypothetical protein
VLEKLRQGPKFLGLVERREVFWLTVGAHKGLKGRTMSLILGLILGAIRKGWFKKSSEEGFF